MSDTPRIDPGGSRRTWTIGDVLRWTTEKFSAGNGFGSPRLDAEVLLAHCLSVPRIRLYVDFAKPLTGDELDRYRAVVRRRLTGEPVAHITREREFWSLPLRVDGRVLVPRPETELLVDKALDWLRPRAAERLRVVDVGTGSGAIAIALGRELPELHLMATDVSAEALVVARANAQRHRVSATFVQADLLAPFARAAFDLIVANPPYIATSELGQLPVEVARFDPRLALDGGADGLALYRRLIPQAVGCLRSGGHLMLEIGAGQAADVSALLHAAGGTDVLVQRDFAGLDRVVSAQFPGQS